MFFVVLASSDIGIGHVSRCLVIAKIFNEKNIEVTFVMPQKADENAENLILSHGYNTKFIPFPGDEITLFLNQKDAMIIADICIPNRFRDRYFVYSIMQSLSSVSERCTVIDGIYSSEHLNQNLTNIFYAVCRPYAGADRTTSKLKADNYFFGSKYSIIDVKKKKGNLSKTMKKVLISTGATDPLGITPKIAESLPKIFPDIDEVLMVYSDIFFNGTISQIENLSRKKPFYARKMVANFLELAMDFDFVITAAGHTRYELSAAKIPFGFFDWNEENITASRIFKEQISCIYFGNLNFKDEELILDVIKQKIYQYPELINLMEINSDTINPLGALELVKKILKINWD